LPDTIFEDARSLGALLKRLQLRATTYNRQLHSWPKCPDARESIDQCADRFLGTQNAHDSDRKCIRRKGRGPFRPALQRTFKLGGMKIFQVDSVVADPDDPLRNSLIFDQVTL
jgi:hypothetical protein